MGGRVTYVCSDLPPNRLQLSSGPADEGILELTRVATVPNSSIPMRPYSSHQSAIGMFFVEGTNALPFDAFFLNSDMTA